MSDKDFEIIRPIINHYYKSFLKKTYGGENNNRDFLVEKNVCVALKKDKDLLATIRRLKMGLARKMQRSIKKFNLTNDLRKICETMVGWST